MRIPSTRLRLPQAEIERCKWGLKMLINFTRTVTYLPDDTQSVDCVPNIRKTKKSFFIFTSKMMSKENIMETIQIYGSNADTG